MSTDHTGPRVPERYKVNFEDIIEKQRDANFLEKLISQHGMQQMRYGAAP